MFKKNRKGSTLALTLIIFAVLMIFATFILNFMVTENKQAMYYQNKTQAYYLARSGAEAVEEAIKTQLYNYSSDINNQKNFIDLYDTPGKEIFVDIDYLTGPVHVVNDEINGRRVITISSSAEYFGVQQTVKKALYSVYGFTNKSGHKPSWGELFLYLGDEHPYEHSNKSRVIPPEYVKQIVGEEKLKYIAHPFKNMTDMWYLSSSDTIANSWKISEGVYKMANGVYGTEGKTTDIIIDGSLTITNEVDFKGNINIYVKDNAIIESGARLLGQVSGALGDQDYLLNIFVYNTSNADFGLVTNDTTKSLKIVGDIFVDRGKVDLSFHKDSLFDGNLTYNGTDYLNFSSTNNGNQVKLLTGSIYAPFSNVHLGIEEDKMAVIVGGQVIADSIDVYVNNNGKGDDFYKNSTKERIGNPIPIDITQGIDTNSIKYESIYLEDNNWYIQEMVLWLSKKDLL